MTLILSGLNAPSPFCNGYIPLSKWSVLCPNYKIVVIFVKTHEGTLPRYTPFTRTTLVVLWGVVNILDTLQQ